MKTSGEGRASLCGDLCPNIDTFHYFCPVYWGLSQPTDGLHYSGTWNQKEQYISQILFVIHWEEIAQLRQCSSAFQSKHHCNCRCRRSGGFFPISFLIVSQFFNDPASYINIEKCFSKGTSGRFNRFGKYCSTDVITVMMQAALNQLWFEIWQKTCKIEGP